MTGVSWARDHATNWMIIMQLKQNRNNVTSFYFNIISHTACNNSSKKL